MSLRISCPNCGDRSIEEWVHGEIPVVPDSITGADERDVDRGYMRDNEYGLVREAWFHLFGCRRWVTLWRDSITDTLFDDPAGLDGSSG